MWKDCIEQENWNNGVSCQLLSAEEINPIKRQQKMTMWKGTVYTELQNHNGLEIKILKRHHYAVDFIEEKKRKKTTNKKPQTNRNFQGIKKMRYWEKTPTKQIYLFVHILYLLCHAYSLYELQGKKYQSFELEQYFTDKLCKYSTLSTGYYVLRKGYQEKAIAKSYSKK